MRRLPFAMLLRREKDLTQEQMAAALGVTSAAVSKWETNAAIPDVAMLCPLARMLGITVDGLLDFRPALEQEEINVLLEDRRKLFEEKRLEEAGASCEALLREYPDDLRLKCAIAGLYILYLTASLEEAWMEEQTARAVALLEQSRESTDPGLAASARSMLMNLYVMQGELDKALAILDEEPEAKINAEMARANIPRCFCPSLIFVKSRSRRSPTWTKSIASHTSPQSAPESRPNRPV